MVAVKERENPLKNVSMLHQKMGYKGPVKDFKIYSEFVKVKAHDSLDKDTARKSIAQNHVNSRLNVTDSKIGLNILEKKTAVLDKSVKINVGRKVLADISNLKGSEKGRTSRTGYTTNLGSKGASLLDKTLKERMKLDIIQATSTKMILKQSENQKISTASHEPKTKKEDHTTIPSGRSTSARIPLNRSRKSVPVLRPVSRIETSSKTKVYSEKSEKLTGKLSFPVKTTISRSTAPPKPRNFSSRASCNRSSDGSAQKTSSRLPVHLRKSLPESKLVSHIKTCSIRKEHSEKSGNMQVKRGFPMKSTIKGSIVPKPSNLSSLPSRIRVSDGFTQVASRAENKVKAGATSRKSVKLTMKTTSAAWNYQRNSVQNVFPMKKLNSRPSVLTKTRQAKVLAPEDSPLIVSNEEPAPAMVISSGAENFGSTSGGVSSRRKSDRRNSFTFSLISRPKDCYDDTAKETLPELYNDRNHLEVSEYVDDIYQYYWVMEAQNSVLKNYMEAQRDLTPQMRGILINWLIEVHLKFELMDETLFLTITLLDRYLSLEVIKKNEMQLVGLTALLLASKYEDFWHPRIRELVRISAESYTCAQMLQMEKTMLKKLKFRLNEPTVYVFMLRFLRAAQSDKEFEHLAFYLIELCLVEYEALNYKPSMLCASAVYVARCTMKITPAWTPLLAKHTRYGESSIRDCADMVLKFHKAAEKSRLKVTYEKYMKKPHMVPIIKPFEGLPV